MTTVVPATFTKVEYDATLLGELFDRARQLVPEVPAGVEVELRVDEDRVTTTARLVGRDPWVVDLHGGAVEEPKRPRTVGEAQSLVVFGRLLFEIADRLDAGFGAPSLPGPDDPALRVAWDAYCVGRTARRGVRVHQPKHRYNFRNRVGFSDAADEAFDRLWAADGLHWGDIEAIVAAVRPAPTG